jgi:hypothetical protein
MVYYLKYGLYKFILKGFYFVNKIDNFAKDFIMENNKSTFDSILEILGILSLFVVVYHAYKDIASKTETTVISDEAIKALQNPEQAKRLRNAVDEYHETGDWDKTELKSIL